MKNVIIVRSQEELDMIPLYTNDIIKIIFGTPATPAIVCNRYVHSIVAYDNSSVMAYNNSSVEAYGNSSVEAYGNSSVVAYGNNSVVAYNNSSVMACYNSSVVAYNNSSVKSYGNSSVEAYGNSSVEAYGNSSVVAYGNSSVEAYGNSSVEARGNSQIVDYLQNANITLFGNARIVYMPRNIEEFMNFYGIKYDDTNAIFFKAVHKKCIDSEELVSYFKYVSDYDYNFKYEIGAKICSNTFDNDPNNICGAGIHVSHKNWALNFGKNWDDLAILEVKVKIEDILLPVNSNGKVRAPEAEVIREVPLEECGLIGKIINKRRKTVNK